MEEHHDLFHLRGPPGESVESLPGRARAVGKKGAVSAEALEHPGKGAGVRGRDKEPVLPVPDDLGGPPARDPMGTTPKPMASRYTMPNPS